MKKTLLTLAILALTTPQAFGQVITAYKPGQSRESVLVDLIEAGEDLIRKEASNKACMSGKFPCAMGPVMRKAPTKAQMDAWRKELAEERAKK